MPQKKIKINITTSVDYANATSLTQNIIPPVPPAMGIPLIKTVNFEKFPENTIFFDRDVAEFDLFFVQDYASKTLRNVLYLLPSSTRGFTYHDAGWAIFSEPGKPFERCDLFDPELLIKAATIAIPLPAPEDIKTTKEGKEYPTHSMGQTPIIHPPLPRRAPTAEPLEPKEDIEPAKDPRVVANELVQKLMLRVPQLIDECMVKLDRFYKNASKEQLADMMTFVVHNPAAFMRDGRWMFNPYHFCANNDIKDVIAVNETPETGIEFRWLVQGIIMTWFTDMVGKIMRGEWCGSADPKVSGGAPYVAPGFFDHMFCVGTIRIEFSEKYLMVEPVNERIVVSL